MADITLAEFDGSVWLVGGEDHLHGLLANELPPGVSIEIHPCSSREEVHELWIQNSTEAEDSEALGIMAVPWVIHPKIVARIKRSALGFVVLFQELSVKLDQESHLVIASAGAQLRERPEVDVTVVSYEDPLTASAVDLAMSDLRMQIVADRLIAEQVVPERIRRERRDKSKATEGSISDRVDIILGVS